MPAIGVACSVPFNLIGYSVGDPKVALVFLITGACLAFFHNVPTLVAFQNMVRARMRATAAFVFFFVTTLVGIGLGPVFLGFLSDFYAGAGAIMPRCVMGALRSRSHRSCRSAAPQPRPPAYAARY